MVEDIAQTLAQAKAQIAQLQERLVRSEAARAPLKRELQDSQEQLRLARQGARARAQEVQRVRTDHRKAEDALRQTEARLAQTQRIAKLGDWEWDAATGRVRWSSEMFRIFGVSPETFTPSYKAHLELVPPEDRTAYDQFVHEALRKMEPFQFEHRILRPNGQIAHAWVFASVLVNAEGEPAGMWGTIQDITARKDAEEALRESRHQLQVANQTLEQRVAERTAEAERRTEQLRHLAAELTQVEQRERRRLADVLHDHMQQLLVAAKLAMGTLRRQVMRDAESVYMCQQVDDLLNESLETSRSLTVELSPTVLHRESFVAALRWLGNWMRDKHGLAVEVQADETIDPQAEAVRVLLFQAVRELLFNIVKHAKVDRAKVTLSRQDHDRVRVAVSDQGVGFGSGRVSSQSNAGSGLGLFGVRERLELLGGDLKIDSAPGKGTVVTMVVALDPAPHTREGLPAADAEPMPAGRILPGRKIRVLLVDDHGVTREGLARFMRACPDIEVPEQANDGRTATRLAAQYRPDVVIMDVSLPDVDGVEVTRQILADVPGTHVIALSLHPASEMAAAMQAAGAVNYLEKTCSLDTVVAAIRNCMLPAGFRTI